MMYTALSFFSCQLYSIRLKSIAHFLPLEIERTITAFQNAFVGKAYTELQYLSCQIPIPYIVAHTRLN